MLTHFTPTLTPCTILTTIVPLFDLIDLVKVIDATIFLGVPCAEKSTRLWHKIAAPQAEFFGVELQMRSAARSRDDEMTAARDDLKISPPEMTPCSARRRASRALLRFSLFVPISASRFRRASARASRSLSGSLEERTNQQCCSSS